MTLGLVVLEEKLFTQMQTRTRTKTCTLTLQSDVIMSADIKSKIGLYVY